jgi:hypothetical protein
MLVVSALLELALQRVAGSDAYNMIVDDACVPLEMTCLVLGRCVKRCVEDISSDASVREPGELDIAVGHTVQKKPPSLIKLFYRTMSRASPVKRPRIADDDAAAVCFRNAPLVYVHIMCHLDALPDRARLARTTRALWKHCRTHDVVLTQMWTTWAVPRIPMDVRYSILMSSQLMPCMQWVWNHDADSADKANDYVDLFISLGSVDGIVFIANQTADLDERRTTLLNAIMTIFHDVHQYKRFDQAIELYEKHVLPLIPSSAETRQCVMASMSAESRDMEVRVMKWSPSTTISELRIVGLCMGMRLRRASLLEYHWRAIVDDRNAIRAMACALSCMVRNNANVDGAAIGEMTTTRARQAGITMEEMSAIWSDGFGANALMIPV